ncbi:hypothetical protein [Streptococcus sp. zg-JUN1979]|uniref:hypothetical protein n=1 Tax=Streptococcus sp. zg-JUN1979 TaxID=3391450 RepID=UPI0039A5D2AE
MFKELLHQEEFEKARHMKKLTKLKKKLMNLEVERCQKMMVKKDVAEIDAKIAANKSAYKKLCKDKS